MRHLAPLLTLLTAFGTAVAFAQLPMHAPPLGTPASHIFTGPYVGPLDAISSGAAATVVSCYALRGCSAAIATALTPAINLKNNVAATQDIKLLASGRLDYSSATSFCGDGAFPGSNPCGLHTTYDQTSAGNTLTPGAPTQLSAFVSATACSTTIPCLFVNGDSGMGINNAIASSFTDPMTMSYVAYFKCSACAAYGEAISLRSASAFSCDTLHNNIANQALTEATSTFTATMSDNHWHAVQATVVNGTNASVLNIDGTETTGTTGHCNSSPTTHIGINTNPPSGGNPWRGYFMEAIIFSSALSSADRTALCQNQQAFYGTGNFPANC